MNRTLDYNQIAALENAGRKAAQEVLEVFNAAIAQYNLDADTVLWLLSRLSAAYIHRVQEVCPDAPSRDAIEDQFHTILDSYLALMDEQELQKEMERERKMNVN